MHLLSRSAVNLADNFGLVEKFAATKFSAKPYLLYLSSVDRKDKEIGSQPNVVREGKVFSDDKINNFYPQIRNCTCQLLERKLL